MAWYSYTLAFFISADQLKIESDIQQLLRIASPKDENFVSASSRNGCLLWRLGSICEIAENGKNLYLLKEASLLDSSEIKNSILQIKDLLREIEKNPSIVVEATKSEYRETLFLHTEGFEPLHAQVVYPDDVIIKDGWVYNFTPHDLIFRIVKVQGNREGVLA